MDDKTALRSKFADVVRPDIPSAAVMPPFISETHLIKGPGFTKSLSHVLL